MKPSYRWLVPIALGWAVFANGARYCEMLYWQPADVGEVPAWQMWLPSRMVLGYALLGVLSGGWLISRMRRLPSMATRIGMVVGYLLALPGGFFFGEFGAFIIGDSVLERYEGIIADALVVSYTGVVGSLPLLVATTIGSGIGTLVCRVSRYLSARH